MSARVLCGLALAFAWIVSSIQAQTAGTGSIQGRVFNPVSKDYVRNAEVRLQGTEQVTYTENDGSFSFQNVPSGNQTVVVTYTGYNTATETFTVGAGQTAVREINLTSTAAGTAAKDGVVQLQAFTVSSEREGNAKAIQAQRRDMNIITSVSSDLFGDVADGNVGEFLKYLPGIDLDYVESEPRGPRLGGMDGQYVGVAFDGMRTASADANRGGDAASRATSFEGFSITSIESIEVNWTNSPENDADTPAGNVNMRTKRAFDRKGRTFSYNLSANFNSEDFTWRKNDGPRDKKDRKWQPNYILNYAESFFNQRLGINLGVSHAYSYTEQIVSSVGYNDDPTPADPRPLVVRTISFKDGPKFIIKDAITLTADWKVTPRLVLSANAIYSYFEGEFWNRNFDFVAANDNANVNNGRSTVGGNGLTTVIATRAPTGSVNNVAQLNNAGGGAAKLTYTRQFAPRFEYKLAGLVVDGAFAFSKSKNNYESLERGFSKDEGGNVPSSFIATRPNEQSWEWTIQQTSGADWFDQRSFTGGTRVTNDDRTWITEKWTGSVNARYVLPFTERFPTTVKIGTKWDEETRDNHDHGQWSQWAYIGPGGNTVTFNPATQVYTVATQGSWSNLGPQYISSNPFELGQTNSWVGGAVTNINGATGRPPRASRNAMAELFAAHPEQFVNIASVDNYYNSFIVNDKNIRQTVTSGYAQADTRFTRKLQLRYGVRYEQTKNDIREYDPLTRAQMLQSPYASEFASANTSRATSLAGRFYQYTSQPQVTRHSKYANWFPSIVAKYNILPNFEWQAGFSKTIGRPPINAIGGLRVVDEQNQRVSLPNPLLEPEHHKKYMTRFAYYFQGRSPGQLTLGLSKTEFTNTLVSNDFTAAQFGNDDPDFDNYTFRSQRNISDRIITTKNLSLGYRQTLGFLPSEYLRGITFFVNYDRTYLTQSGDGTGPQVRRSNVTPHRVSSGVSYRLRKFSASLNMIWGDDRPESSTYGRYYGALTKFDGTLGYNVSNRLGFFVQMRNITNVKDEYYQSPPGVQEGKQGYLRSMEEYGSNWIFGVKGTF
jgi:iron complex outermembrane recepter protein